ncbi:MAG: nucleotidyltransferase family protein [Armatimonadota bacterium]
MKKRIFKTYKEILEELRLHNNILKKHHLKRIGLFGSYARTEQNKNSDIDFLAEFEKPSFDDFIDLVFFLENLFKRKVDLITKDSLSPYVKPYVKKEVKWHEV